MMLLWVLLYFTDMYKVLWDKLGLKTNKQKTMNYCQIFYIHSVCECLLEIAEVLIRHNKNENLYSMYEENTWDYVFNGVKENEKKKKSVVNWSNST